MALRVFNTLSGRVEELKTLEPERIRMYSCGPTVYDYGHIGNFRTFVFIDLFRRFLRQSGYRLNHVMNITDVDDKIIRNSLAKGIGVREYAARYEQAFFEDMQILSLEKPEHIARATEHIPEMVSLIERLAKKDFAYKTEDGSYYFRIANFPAYGKLSKKDMTGISDGARVDVDEYEKDNVRDFALWKSPKPGEAKWDSEIGPGRPGWHIECSAMAMEYLGDTLDVHLGGEDLIFPHHENEIAQSEAATGKTFSRYWMHVRFLLVEGQKMSKSLGNFYTPRDLMLKGHKASSIRFLLSSVPYQKQLNFTFDGLTQAASSVERLRNFKLRLNTGHFEEGTNPEMGSLAAGTRAKMRESLEDDMNTAQALAAIFDMVREANAAADAGKLFRDDIPHLRLALSQFDEVFAVLEDDDAAKVKQVQEWARAEGKVDESAVTAPSTLADSEIEALIERRQQARTSRDFAQADAIRKQLADAGIILEDTKDGLRWKRK
jgi:cysteinyl-tRNA synthetase